MDLARLGIKVESDGVKTANNRLDKMESTGARAEKSVSKLQKRLDKLNKIAQKTGKFLTKFVTAPILALGVVAVKLSSDFNESLNKIDVAFGNSQEVIHEWSQTTADNIGVSQGKAMDMVATMGDMATSMGLTQRAAAEMGKEIVNRAGDLASFKNIRIDMAESAMKGIFTGETESLKGLGVVMTQTSLASYALSQGITQNIKDMTQAEKVTLRYNFVMDATNNSANDFANTSDSLANMLRSIRARLENTAVTFGQKFLPIVEKAAGKVLDFVDKLSALDEKQLELILTFAGIAAAAGPLILAIGKISQAFSFLAANPAVAVAVGLAAVVIGIIAIDKAIKDSKVKAYTNQLQGLADELELTADQIGGIAEDVQKTLNQFLIQDTPMGGLGEIVSDLITKNKTQEEQLIRMSELVEQISSEYGITRLEAVRLIETNENLRKKHVEMLDSLKDQFKARDGLQRLAEVQAKVTAQEKVDREEIAAVQKTAYVQALARAEAEEAAAKAIEIQNRLLREQVLKGRTDAYQGYLNALEVANIKEKFGLIATIELTQAKLDAEEAYVDYLIKSGITSESVFNGHLNKLKQLRKAMRVFDELSEKAERAQAFYDNIATWKADFNIVDDVEIEKLKTAEEKIQDILDTIDTGKSEQAKQIQELNELFAQGEIEIDQYTDAVNKANAALTELTTKELLTNLGKVALDAAIVGLEELGSVVADIAINGDKAGKSFEDAMLAIGESILRALPNLFLQAGLQIIGTNLPVGLALLAAAGVSAFGVGMVDEVKSQASASGNAHGNVFSNGAITPFAKGGYVERPTLFPMQNGSTGMMGEKGIEAIMPVKRMANGNLGVESSGSGAQVNITIVNNSGENVETNEKQNGSTREIEVIIGNTVKKQLGNGSLDSSMRSNYGVKRQGVPG